MAASVVWMEKGAWVSGCPCGWRSGRFSARFSARRAWREHEHIVDVDQTTTAAERPRPLGDGMTKALASGHPLVGPGTPG